MQLYVVRKYIMAKSAKHALKLEGKVHAQDVWIDDKWKDNQENYKQIGFNYMACKKKGGKKK